VTRRDHVSEGTGRGWIDEIVNFRGAIERSLNLPDKLEPSGRRGMEFPFHARRRARHLLVAIGLTTRIAPVRDSNFRLLKIRVANRG
jgi:hypothetical protein